MYPDTMLKNHLGLICIISHQILLTRIVIDTQNQNLMRLLDRQ